MTKPIPVYVEVGSKRVFASAAGWPGWCRSGTTEDAALETLAAYAPRFAAAAAEAGVRFAVAKAAPRFAAAAAEAGVTLAPGAARTGVTFDVVERLPGSATTDFGAPGAIAEGDHRRVKESELRLVQAAWTILDRVAAASPAELRKGPRGGGRDRDAIVRHVAEAEAAYARKIGCRDHDRHAIVAALRAAPADPPKGWPAAYAARRIAWHALDHAWEIEDRVIC